MNRLHCSNCQASWPSLPLDQLERPQTCPACGDELVDAHQLSDLATATPQPAPVAELHRAA
jgi:predicted amidophosphoribosyltransferase